MLERNKPEISVILPVYNGAAWLRESIDSILAQDFRDFELIILNDGSKDASESIIKSYEDPRIVYLSHENRGLAATLNRGIEAARGAFIARQDQDDLSLPARLSRQLAYLKANPACGMVGAWSKIFSETDASQRYHRHPTLPSEILYDLLFNNPFVHSSMMIRKSVFDTVGFYCTDRERQPPEDYELWSRIARVYPVANLPEVLVMYREVATGMSNSGVNPFYAKVYKISRENMAFALGMEYRSPVIADLADLLHENPELKSVKTSYGILKRCIRQLGSYCREKPGASGTPVTSRERNSLLRIRSGWLRLRFGNFWGGVFFIPDRLRRKFFHLISSGKGENQ